MRKAEIITALLLVCATFTHALLFLDYADTRSSRSRHETILSLMNDENPGLILNCGDLADGYQDQFISVLQAEPNVNTLLNENLYLVAKGSDSHDEESWLKGLRPTVLRNNSLLYSWTVENCFFVCNGQRKDASPWLEGQLASPEAQAAQPTTQ